MRTSLAAIASALHARLQGRDAVCTGVSIDTRTLVPGDLFAALPGARVDGHEFLEQARERGAAGALVSRRARTALPLIRVPDTQRALGALAHWWRKAHAPRVAAVTGANGKTTVKEMLAAICRAAGPTLATRGNRNNEIGVPLTLFELASEHRYAVIEMGANHPGEIHRLAGLTEPEAGVVTNAAAVHLEGFGSLEGAARAEGGELVAQLPAEGTAVINADDDFAPMWRDMSAAGRVLTFAMQADADLVARPDGETAVLHTPAGEIRFAPALAGRHNLMNAAAAAAAALALDLPADTIREGLERVRPVAGRLDPRRAPGGYDLIDDSYNANPASLAAGIELLVTRRGEPWLVLGEMAELGAGAGVLHAEAGRAAKDAGVARLFTVGAAARPAAEGFGAGAEHFENQQALIEALLQSLHPGVSCLVKGSRRAAMERVVEALLANDNEDNARKRAGGGA